MSDSTAYTYIYGELDEEDNIVYVGRSNNPRLRNLDKKIERFMILDKFIDLEQSWIHRLSSSGIKLRNKEVIKTCGDFEVGKIYNTYLPPNIIKHIPSQLVFESKYAASRFFGKNLTWCSQQIKRNNPDWEVISHT